MCNKQRNAISSCQTAETSLPNIKGLTLVAFIYRQQTVHRLFGLQLQRRHHEFDGEDWIVEAMHSVPVHHPCRSDPMTEVNTSYY